MPASHLAIRAEGIGKRFLIGTKAERPTLLQSLRHWAIGDQPQKELWALRGVDLEVHQGEVLGIIGANGAGKSTLLMLLADILTPSEGTLEVVGKVNPFFQLAAGLQSELTVQENILICAALLGMSSSELKKRLPDIIEFSGLEKYLFAKFGELSTGLAARLPFTTAIHADVDVLLVDEMLSVGDIAFQDRCIVALRKLIRQGKTLVIVSHSVNLIRKLCPNVLYLRDGKTMLQGSSDEVIARYTEDMGVPAASAATEPAAQVVVEIRTELRETGGKILAAIEELKRPGRARETVERSKPAFEERQTSSPGGAVNPADKSSKYSEAVRVWRSALRIPHPVMLADSFLSSIWAAIAAAMSPRSGSFLRVGDEVITTAYNYPGVLPALEIQGLVPVLTDLNPRSFNLDVDLIERSLTPRTRAVLVPHLAGTSAPMDQISAFCRDKGLILIELNHYATGFFRETALGTFGDFGACGLLHTIELPPEWGVLISRKAVLSDIFTLDISSGRMMSVSEDPARRMLKVLGRIPKISMTGLESSIATCGRIEAAIPRWKAIQSEYARFFSQFPDLIRVPACAGADVNKERFTIVLESQAPIAHRMLTQSLAEAGFLCRPYLPFSSLEEANKRLPNSLLLLERGITLDLSEEPERREKFFSLFSSLLNHKVAL